MYMVQSFITITLFLVISCQDDYWMTVLAGDEGLYGKLSSLYHESRGLFNTHEIWMYNNCTESMSKSMEMIISNNDISPSIKSLNGIQFNDCPDGASFIDVVLPFSHDEQKVSIGYMIKGLSRGETICLPDKPLAGESIPLCIKNCGSGKNCITSFKPSSIPNATCFGYLLLEFVIYCGATNKKVIKKKNPFFNSSLREDQNKTDEIKPEIITADDGINKTDTETCLNNEICLSKKHKFQMISFYIDNGNTTAQAYPDSSYPSDSKSENNTSLITLHLIDGKNRDSLTCYYFRDSILMGKVHVHYEGLIRDTECIVESKCEILWNISSYYHYFENCLAWYYYYGILISVTVISFILSILLCKFVLFPCLYKSFMLLLFPLNCLYNACRCHSNKEYYGRNVRYTSKGIRVDNSIAPNTTNVSMHRTWFFGTNLIFTTIFFFTLISIVGSCDVVLSTDSFKTICEKQNTSSCSDIYMMELTITTMGQTICYFKESKLNKILIKEVYVDCIPEVEYYVPIYDVHKVIDNKCLTCHGFCEPEKLEKCICEPFGVAMWLYGCNSFVARKAMKLRLSAKSGYIGKFATVKRCVRYETVIKIVMSKGVTFTELDLVLGTENVNIFGESILLSSVSNEVPHVTTIVEVLEEEFAVNANLRNEHILGSFGAVQCPTEEDAKNLSKSCKIDPDSVVMNWESQSITLSGMDNIDYLRELKESQSNAKELTKLNNKYRHSTNGIFPVKIIVSMKGKPDSELFSDIDLDSVKITISGKRLERNQGVVIITSGHQEGVALSVSCKGISSITISTSKEGNSTHSCTIFDTRMIRSDCIITSYNKVRKLTADVTATNYDIHLVDVLPPTVYDDSSKESDYSRDSIFWVLIKDHFVIVLLMSFLLILYLIKIFRE